MRMARLEILICSINFMFNSAIAKIVTCLVLLLLLRLSRINVALATVINYKFHIVVMILIKKSFINVN